MNFAKIVLSAGLTALVLPLSLAQAASPGERELRCFKKAEPRLLRYVTDFTSEALDRFHAEGKRLDQIFRPELYVRGPHVPYVSEKWNQLSAEQSLKLQFADRMLEAYERERVALDECVLSAVTPAERLKSSGGELACYREHLADVVALQGQMMMNASGFERTQYLLLDAIARPEAYTRGPHVPFTSQNKSDLIELRRKHIEEIQERFERIKNSLNRFEKCQSGARSRDSGDKSGVQPEAIAGRRRKAGSEFPGRAKEPSEGRGGAAAAKAL